MPRVRGGDTRRGFAVRRRGGVGYREPIVAQPRQGLSAIPEAYRADRLRRAEVYLEPRSDLGARVRYRTCGEHTTPIAVNGAGSIPTPVAALTGRLVQGEIVRFREVVGVAHDSDISVVVEAKFAVLPIERLWPQWSQHYSVGQPVDVGG